MISQQPWPIARHTRKTFFSFFQRRQYICLDKLRFQVFPLASAHFKHFWKAAFAEFLSAYRGELKALGLLWAFGEAVCQGLLYLFDCNAPFIVSCMKWRKTMKAATYNWINAASNQQFNHLSFPQTGSRLQSTVYLQANYLSTRNY